MGCTSYVHRNKLIGAPQFDGIEQKKEFIYKKNGLGYQKSSSAGLILLALFIGLVIGASIFGFISRSKITIRRQGTEDEERIRRESAMEENINSSHLELANTSTNTEFISNKKTNQKNKQNWGLDAINDDQL